MLKLYAISDDPVEVESARLLGNLFGTFKNLASLNYEAESIGIDKLVRDLERENYLSIIKFLHIGKYITRMKDSNQNFKKLFSNRMVTEANTESYDLKAIRTEILTIYNEFTGYTLAMARALNTPLFSTSLVMLNSARKYYADLIARRTSIKTPIEQPTA